MNVLDKKKQEQQDNSLFVTNVMDFLPSENQA